VQSRVQSCFAGARVSAAASGAELGARYRASCGVVADGATKRFAPPASPSAFAVHSVPDYGGQVQLHRFACPFRPKTPKRHGSHRRRGATKAIQPGGLYAPRRRLATLPRVIPGAFQFGASRGSGVKHSHQHPAFARCLNFFTHLLRGFARHLGNGSTETRIHAAAYELHARHAQFPTILIALERCVFHA